MGFLDTISKAITGRNDSSSFDLSLYKSDVDSAGKSAQKILESYRPQQGYQSALFDPFMMIRQMGYKDRTTGIHFEVMRRFAEQMGVLSTIIQVRASQVAAFAQPYRHTRTLGFQVRHKNRDHKTTGAEKAVIQMLEQAFMNCGRGDNPHERGPRPDFEDMLKASVRDTLTFDHDCLEVVPDKRGVPFSWRQVDASLIRFASPSVLYKQVSNSHVLGSEKEKVYEASFIDSLKKTEYKPTDIMYVQVLRDIITAVYSSKDMIVSVRNPTTNIRSAGYGTSEIEMVVNILTSHMNAEKYNFNQFKHGSDPEGLLNIQDENFDGEQIEAFRRQWRAEVAGWENSFRMPILQASAVQFIPMGRSQKEAEFMQWMEYLIKVITGVYLIDPEEINMYVSRGAPDSSALETSSENRIKFSKDKGLRPLLRFQAKKMQRILDGIDDHFMFEFVGLDEMTEQEKLDKSRLEVETFKTINEIRKENDLPAVIDGEVPLGDIPLNPTFIQWYQVKSQEKQLKEQRAAEAQQMQAAQQFAGNMGGQAEHSGQMPPAPNMEESAGVGDRSPDGIGSDGGVPVGWTTGANPRVKYANETKLDMPNKSLNTSAKQERRIELVIED